MEHESPDLLLLGFFGGVVGFFVLVWFRFFSLLCFTYFYGSSALCLEPSRIPKGMLVQSKHAFPLPMFQTSWP